MKIKTWVEVTKEIDVTIDLDDVMAEFSSLGTPENKHEVMQLLSMCIGAIDKVPDSLIAELGENSREIVVAAMQKQAARYMTPNVKLRGSPASGRVPLERRVGRTY